MNQPLLFTAGRKAQAAKPPLREIYREPPAFTELTDYELIASVGRPFVFDVESYVNYFLVSFMCIETERVVYFELSPDSLTFNRDKYDWVLQAFTLYGFNSNIYDVPMCLAARVKQTPEQLKEITNAIIRDGRRPWQIRKDFGIPNLSINHVDIREVAPLDESLKKYAARMHAKRLQELPYPPDTVLTREQASRIKAYNIGADLPNTRLLFLELKEQLAMRDGISKLYGEDVRSKSDAQIAEVIIRSEVKKLTGKEPEPAVIEPGWQFQYKVPSYVQFQTPQLQKALEIVRNAWFEVNAGGYPKCPQVQEINIQLGSHFYQMGLGGLHSQEKSVAHIEDEHTKIEDFDVASYYPRLILNAGMYPRGCGEVFTPVFESIVDRRLAAKVRMQKAEKAGEKPNPQDETEANSLKITANGTFGKLANMYSAMYSPDLMAQVTITGQLCLFLFIEMMHAEGIEAISGNTDGVILMYPRTRENDVRRVTAAWSQRVGLEMEITPYKAIYQRDVNNYIAIKPDGKVKLKGVYAEKGSTGNSRLSKNPECLILSDAVVAFLTKGTPLHDTIYGCKDFTRFVAVRQVKGGAQFQGAYLGKTVRWYYAKGSRDAIRLADSGNLVAKSEGAKPCLDLPDEFPADLDHDRYLADAIETLYDIGYMKRQTVLF